MNFSYKKLFFFGIISLLAFTLSAASETELYLTFQKGTTELDLNNQNALNQIIQNFDLSDKVSISFYYETYSTEMEVQNNLLYNKITQSIVRFSKTKVQNIALEKTDFIETAAISPTQTRVLVVLKGTEKAEKQQMFAYNNNIVKNEKVLKLPSSSYVITPNAHAVAEEANMNVSVSSPTIEAETQEEELIIDDAKALYLSPNMKDGKVRPIYH